MIAAPRAERVPANVAPPPASRGISGAAARLVYHAARAPLLTKLLLASAVIDVSAFVVLSYTVEQYSTEVWVVTLLVTHLVNGALAYAALLPLGTLQAAASRVAEGDLDARARLRGSPTATSPRWPTPSTPARRRHGRPRAHARPRGAGDQRGRPGARA
jgi:hypothetical protein